MGVLQVLHGISIVFLSLRKSLQDWQLRSGGRISRRRFFLFRPRLPPDLSPRDLSAVALTAALGAASAVTSDVSGAVADPSAAGSTGAGAASVLASG